MFTYVQITEDGTIVGISHLSGEVNSPNLIRVPNDFDITNKKWNGKEFIDYVPEVEEKTKTQIVNEINNALNAVAKQFEAIQELIKEIPENE